ncbi:hypothetical protein DL93DRAFT_2104364 [Clavulina sp. PMI_390]|nr:hypothetical protein DL93DRAFT_2104364 [Clavulina sp. PMI_390]
MSQLNDETLRKILAQIQATAHMAQRNLSMSQAQKQQKEKDRRILQLTIAEINEMPKSEDIQMYKGVGKMFLNVPRNTMENDLKQEEKDMADEMAALNKKIKFLDKQYQEANAQLRDIFHNADSK